MNPNQQAGRQGRTKYPVRSTKWKKKTQKKNEESLRELQDNMKSNNICTIGIPNREEKKQGIENLFEKMMRESFPNLVKENIMQVQEAQRVPNRINPKRPTARYIIIKMPNVKDKENLKGDKGETASNIQGNSDKAIG